MSPRNLTLVTGAGGFVGGWVAETLFLKNEPVRAGVHSWSGAARPARFRMDIVPCNIMSPAELDEAMQDVTCVIHCAKGADESIAQSTRNVLEAAYQHGVERFVHISTTAVFGEQSGRIDETFPCQGMQDSYADNKILAEDACWEYHKKGLPVVILRPPIVYGPFSKTFTVNLAYKLMAGNWGIFKGAADGICNLIYVTDLVNGILLASQSENAIGEAFILNGPELPTWNQYFECFNDALGLPPLKVYENQSFDFKIKLMEPIRNSVMFARDHFEWLIKLVAAKQRQARRTMKFVETRMKTMPRIHDLKLYRRDALYLHHKAHQMLGYQPAVDLGEGLHMSVQWLEQIGMRQFQYTKGAR
jgi:nucleoside-diphosphate-sugar epimerase